MLTIVRLCLVLILAAIFAAGQVIGGGGAGMSFDSPGERGFFENRGQVDPGVRFYSIFSRGAVYFTDQGPVLELRQFVPSEGDSPGLTARLPERDRERRQPGSTRRFAVGVRFAGASGPTRIEPIGNAGTSRRYYFGTGARVDAPAVTAFERVAYRSVWPGIDIVYSASAHGLDYEIIVAPGADSSRVGFEYDGATAVNSSAGATRILTPLGAINDLNGSERSPGGRLEWLPASIDPRQQDTNPNTVRVFTDPVSILAGTEESWGAFLGGASDEAVYAVVVDAAGRVLVTGATRSGDFPTTLGVVDTTFAASFDVFVSQLSDDGTTLLWSTYVGGIGDDRGWAIALDSTGRPVVAGVTSSSDFPTTPGAYDETPNGGYDTFLFRLAADGSSLEWSTLYGGSDAEWDVSGLDVDQLDRLLLSGSTRSGDLPITPVAVTSVLQGETDAFVARFAADGSALNYGTYLGGAGWDEAEDVVATAAGGAIVVGRTDSTDFPVTAGVFQPSPNPGSKNGFATGIAPDGASLSFSTYLGGTGSDDPYAVALDDLGRPVIAGKTSSADFPTTVGAYAPLPIGGEDAFVTKIEVDASAIVWSTYFGGASTDRALDLVRDGTSGFAFAGWTCSEDLSATPNAFSSEYPGPCAGFVARLSQDGSALNYASYIGGWRDDSAFGLAVDPLDRLVVVGETWSTNFPVTPTSFEPLHNSPNTAEDGFVLTLGTSAICTSITVGAEGPELLLDKAPDGVCPDAAPLTSRIHLIEGRLDSLAPTTLGPVTPIACYALGALGRTISIPNPGMALFQLARLSAGGSYDDGGGEGLSASRQPASGDCP